MVRSSILSWKLLAINEALCYVCIANENLIVDWFSVLDAVINFAYQYNPCSPSIFESHFIIEKKA